MLERQSSLEQEPAAIPGCPMSIKDISQEATLYETGQENLTLTEALSGVYMQIRWGAGQEAEIAGTTGKIGWRGIRSNFDPANFIHKAGQDYRLPFLHGF